MTRRPSRRSLWPRAAVLLLTAALFSAHVATPAPAFAQIRRYAAEDPSVTAIYGRGVHAYFAGQLAAAEQQLSQAIDAGSRDPRVYYFRAMTRLRMGRGREAQHDMQMGAALEAKNPGQRRSINQALVRVQGNDRKTLENYRRLAKLQLAQENRQLAARKYGAATPQGPQRGVVRQPARVPMEALVGEPSIRVVRPYGTPSSSPAPLEAPALSPPVAQQQPIETPTTVQGDAGVAPAEAVVPAEPQIGDSAPPRADQDERPLGVDVPATDQFAEDAADPSEEDAFGGFGELEVPAVETPDFPAEEGDAEPVAAADEPADEATEVDADGDLFGFDPETETPSEEFPAADDELTAETGSAPTSSTPAGS